MAWLQSFSNKPGIQGWVFARVRDPFGVEGLVEVEGCPIFSGRLVDDSLLASESYWKPVAGELADAILALRNEVEAAKAE